MGRGALGAEALSDTTANALNLPRWDGRRRGYYEVWYLTLVHRATGAGLWFRYTTHVPFSPLDPLEPVRHEPEAEVWATYHDARDPASSFGLRQPFPIAAYNATSAPFRLAVGANHFDGRHAVGSVGEGDRSLAWDISFEPDARPHEHFPESLHRIGIAKTCVNSQNLHVRMSGTVRVGSRALALDGEPGEQSHVFGTRHAERWAWAHCNAFREEPGAVFEGVSARVRKLGLLLPPGTSLLLRRGHEDSFATRGILALFRPTSTFDLGRWTFEGRSGDLVLRGEATCPHERFIAVEYRDPDGTPCFCHNSETASLRIELLRRAPSGELVREVELTSDGTAAMEIAGRDRDPRVARVLESLPAAPHHG